MKPFILGIIGVGSCGKIQCKAIANVNSFTLQAICDLESISIEGATYYSTYQELLQDVSVDAVSIATPPNSHFQITMDSIAAGKHVMVDKPHALKVEECVEMAAFAKEKEKVLYMAFHARHNPAVEAAKNELQEKTIKKIVIEYSEYAPNYHAIDGWIFDPVIGGGGVLMDSGINALSIVTYVVPKLPVMEIVDVQFQKAPGFRVETKATVDFCFGEDGQGSISMDWMNKGAEVRQVIFSTDDGDYKVDIVKNIFSKNGEAILTIDPTREMVDQVSEYTSVFEDFAKHLGKPEPAIHTKELEFILQAYNFHQKTPSQNC